MSEGNVYLCLWKKHGRNLTLSLMNDASVKVSAGSLDAAEEKMWELLCHKFGDGEAVLEYETPPPQKEARFVERYGSPHLVVVSGNDGVGKLVNSKELHPKGYCRDCQLPLESLPGVVPEYDWLPSSDGAISQELGSFFSGDFLSLLTDEERSGLKVEPVHGPKGKGKVFFHLEGEPCVHCVGVPGFEGLLNDECRGCKRALDICYLRNCKLFQFIALTDLPKRLPTVFAVGWPRNVSLCMTRRRYSQIIGKRGTRNITSRRIWVVPDKQFVRRIDIHSHPLDSRWAPKRFFEELA